MSTPPPPPPGIPPRSPYAPPSASGPRGPAGPSGNRLPWEERDRIGLVDAFIQTVQLVVMEPADAFSRLRQDGDLVSPIFFGVLISWIGMFFTQLWQLLFGSALSALFGGIEGASEVFASPTLVSFVATLVFFPVLFIIGLFLGAGILHLCLMMVGATNDSPIGFEGTVKVYAYAQVASLAAILPFAGSIVQAIWGLVLMVIGLAEAHRTTRGKAAIAVIIPIVVCCACVLIAGIVFGAMIAAALSGMGSTQ